jgi:GTP-sensing pleiotropic transcriptional regulator CodY
MRVLASSSSKEQSEQLEEYSQVSESESHAESAIVENFDEREGRDVESRMTEGIMCTVCGVGLLCVSRLDKVAARGLVANSFPYERRTAVSRG